MKTAWAVFLVASGTSALGCPICDSPTGAAVREGIFNGDFYLTFFEVVSPFGVVGLALWVLNRYLPD